MLCVDEVLLQTLGLVVKAVQDVCFDRVSDLASGSSWCLTFTSAGEVSDEENV